MRVIGRPAPAPFSALFLRSNGTGKLIIEKRKPNMWFVNACIIAESLIERGWQVIPKRCGSGRIGDNPT
jgi:hypothetical protein